jgi:hypothetical protein
MSFDNSHCIADGLDKDLGGHSRRTSAARRKASEDVHDRASAPVERERSTRKAAIKATQFIREVSADLLDNRGLPRKRRCTVGVSVPKSRSSKRRASPRPTDTQSSQDLRSSSRKRLRRSGTKSRPRMGRTQSKKSQPKGQFPQWPLLKVTGRSLDLQSVRGCPRLSRLWLQLRRRLQS